jgi:lactate dehydrogenase-like 2-hydroxyacid dehydrogenase
MNAPPARPRVVATARAFCASDGPHQAIIRDAGLELVLAAGSAPLTAAQLVPLAADADALLLGLDRCDASVFAAAPRLRVVSRFGAGVDSVDLEAAARHGVTVTTTPDANTVAVAELTLGLLLALARDLPAALATARAAGPGRPAGNSTARPWGWSGSAASAARSRCGPPRSACGWSATTPSSTTFPTSSASDSKSCGRARTPSACTWGSTPAPATSSMAPSSRA